MAIFNASTFTTTSVSLEELEKIVFPPELKKRLRRQTQCLEFGTHCKWGEIRAKDGMYEIKSAELFTGSPADVLVKNQHETHRFLQCLVGAENDWDKALRTFVGRT